jgi:hypothetical protein
VQIFTVLGLLNTAVSSHCYRSKISNDCANLKIEGTWAALYGANLRCCPSIEEHVSRAENGAERAEKSVNGSGAALSGGLQNTEYSESGVGVCDRERSGRRTSEKLVERQFSSPPLICCCDRQPDIGFLMYKASMMYLPTDLPFSIGLL